MAIEVYISPSLNSESRAPPSDESPLSRQSVIYWSFSPSDHQLHPAPVILPNSRRNCDRYAQVMELYTNHTAFQWFVMLFMGTAPNYRIHENTPFNKNHIPNSAPIGPFPPRYFCRLDVGWTTVSARNELKGESPHIIYQYSMVVVLCHVQIMFSSEIHLLNSSVIYHVLLAELTAVDKSWRNSQAPKWVHGVDGPLSQVPSKWVKASETNHAQTRVVKTT